MSSGVRIYQGCYWSAKSPSYEAILALILQHLHDHATVLKALIAQSLARPLLDLVNLTETDFQEFQAAACDALAALLAAPESYRSQFSGDDDEYRHFQTVFSLLNAMLKTDLRAVHSGRGSLIIAAGKVWQAADTWFDLLVEHIAIAAHKPELAEMLLNCTTYHRSQGDLSALSSDDFYPLAAGLNIYFQRYARYIPGMSSVEVFTPLFPCLYELYRLMFFDPRYYHPLVTRLVAAPDLESTLHLVMYLRHQALDAMESNTFETLAVIHSATSYFIEYFSRVSSTSAGSLIDAAEGLRTSLENFSKNVEWVDTFPSDETLVEAVDRWVSARR